METTEIVHDPDPFQNRPALGASREIDVEAPVRGGRRMLEDVGIHPLDFSANRFPLSRPVRNLKAQSIFAAKATC
jgi:hypothetical protein